MRRVAVLAAAGLLGALAVAIAVAQSSPTTVAPNQAPSLRSAGGPALQGPAAPIPPRAYKTPANARIVSTSAQLASALRRGKSPIVLADGSYGGSKPFSDPRSVSIYAQHLGRAVLTVGLVVGGSFGPGGATVAGVRFKVSDPTLVFQSGELTTWGQSGNNTRVLDSTFDGSGKVPIGLNAYNPTGLVAQRLTFTNFTEEGIRASNNRTVPYGAATSRINVISDISVNGVSDDPPGASNGTAEAGVWVGQPVINGVHRIKVRGVSISGIETVNDCWNTTFADLDIDMSGPNASSGVGVYMEHFTLHDIFTSFLIKGVRTGFNAESDAGVAGNGAAHFNTIENGTIDATGWPTSAATTGIYLDQGSEATTVANVRFENQTSAGIVVVRNIGTNSFMGNTFQLAPGVSHLAERQH